MRIHPARGLAAGAVAALALTGLAISSSPVAHAEPGDPVFLSQFNDGADASTRFDGWDNAIRLVAQVPDPAAEVSFEYNLDPEATDATTGWTRIGDATPSGGYVSLTWDAAGPQGTTLEGRLLALRVVSRTGSGSAEVTTTDVRNDVRVRRASSATETVTLSGRNGGVLGGTSPSPAPGFFRQPYADSDREATRTRLSGATSATDGTVAVSWIASDGTLRGTVDAAVAPTTFKDPNGGDFDTISGGAFSTVLDLSGSGVQDGDIMAFAAERDTDEVWVTPVYEQVIGSVTTETSPSRAGQPASVTITVTDDAGTGTGAITGVEVRRSSDDSLVGYTDAGGTVTTTQADGTTESYYANATDADPYDAADGDVVSGDVVVVGYTPQQGGSTAEFDDGGAFDIDEYTLGDVYVQVYDQQGQPLGAGTPVNYRVRHDGSAPAVLQTAVTDESGRAPIDLGPSYTTGGEYQLDWRVGGDTDPGSADDLQTATFVTGQSTLRLRPRGTAQGEAGGEIPFTADLTVEGVPLVGRPIELSYTRGYEVVPGSTPDAGMLTDEGVVLRQTLTTDRGGVVDVVVDDRQESTLASELGGVLRAATGTAVATEASTLDGDADADDTAGTRFGDGTRGRVAIRLTGTGAGAGDDRLRVLAPSSVAGETVRVFKVANRRLVLLRERRLNSAGNLAPLTVLDRNRAASTTYVVRLVPSKRVLGATSNRLPLA